jgi:hypothetical protein
VHYWSAGSSRGSWGTSGNRARNSSTDIRATAERIVLAGPATRESAFENDHTPTDSPRTALGVKGIGEAATIGSTPPIANAVPDALAPRGVTHVDLPLTAQKIWAALRAAPTR